MIFSGVPQIPEVMGKQWDINQMVFGIGIDIIEIDRIERSVERFGEHFLKKVFDVTIPIGI